jgi:hypothetical protein
VAPQRPDIRYVPGGQVQRRRGEPTLLTRAELAQHQAQRRGDAVAAAYLAEQDPAAAEQVRPGEPGRDEPVWGNLDYDLYALADLHGPACLCCRIERTRADLANPDGLCVECRDNGFTRKGVIDGYCTLVAERNPGQRDADLLREAWNRAADRTGRSSPHGWRGTPIESRAPSTPPARLPPRRTPRRPSEQVLRSPRSGGLPRGPRRPSDAHPPRASGSRPSNLTHPAQRRSPGRVYSADRRDFTREVRCSAARHCSVARTASRLACPRTSPPGP